MAPNDTFLDEIIPDKPNATSNGKSQVDDDELKLFDSVALTVNGKTEKGVIVSVVLKDVPFVSVVLDLRPDGRYVESLENAPRANVHIDKLTKIPNAPRPGSLIFDIDKISLGMRVLPDIQGRLEITDEKHAVTVVEEIDKSTNKIKIYRHYYSSRYDEMRTARYTMTIGEPGFCPVRYDFLDC
jgi:hypothetical protein